MDSEGFLRRDSSLFSPDGLDTAFTNTVKDMLSSVSEEMFINSYKECYQYFDKNEDIVRPALGGSSKEAKAYKAQFDNIILENMSLVISEAMESLESKIKELNKLKTSQSDNHNQRFNWRPPGDAIKHMVSFNNVSKGHEMLTLQNKSQQLTEEVNILKARLQQKREKAKNLSSSLKQSFADIQLMACDKVDREKDVA